LSPSPLTQSLKARTRNPCYPFVGDQAKTRRDPKGIVLANLECVEGPNWIWLPPAQICLLFGYYYVPQNSEFALLQCSVTCMLRTQALELGSSSRL
jgi:hypothetical protein